MLARNIVKLVVERRRGLPFSRFRAKLVLAMLGLTIIPSVLVLIVGGQLIRQTHRALVCGPGRRRAPVGAAPSRPITTRERQAPVAGHAERIARRLPPAALQSARRHRRIRAAIERRRAPGSRRAVEVYQRPAGTDRRSRWSPSNRRRCRRGPRACLCRSAGGAHRLGQRRDAPHTIRSTGGGELVRAGAPVADAAAGAPIGVVIASDYLSGSLAQHSRRITDAYEGYRQLLVMKPALEGVYLSVFLMMTLMILVSATWMGLYLAKRITRPVQLLAAGAREIGAGRLDHRIEPETRDEFGSLVEAFNTMAGELAASQRKLERSRLDLEQKNVEVEERRRYIETILERIATGVVSIGGRRRIETVNAAALRLLGLDENVIGAPADEVFAREDLRPLQQIIRRAQERSRGAGGAGDRARPRRA